MGVVHPTQGGAVAVRVVNPSPGPAPAPRSGTWRNECERIPRLGQEARFAWIGRVERYVESRPHRLASITYPPGDGVDLALVCFSSPE